MTGPTGPAGMTGPTGPAGMTGPTGPAGMANPAGVGGSLADQTRFDAFGGTDIDTAGGPPAPAGQTYPVPAATAPAVEAEQPVPQVRNGRVLLAVLAAALLLLVVPLGIVWLVTRSPSPSFEVGSCVRKSGSEAVVAQCTDGEAFTVVARVDNQSKCTDPPGQPYVVVSDGGKQEVLCLRPAATR